MSLTPGTRLGPYEIVSLLGAGGMGEVYLAHDPRLGRHVAVKILPAAFSADPDRLWRFEREARAVASLNHPHICTVHDIGEHEGHRYLVMERLEGEPLNNRLESGPLATPLLLDLAVQIADALDAAHSAGVIHRDLKPANIFITKRGEAKLLDFGLAKLADAEDQEAEVATLPPGANDVPTMPKRGGATSVGTLMGTAAYMSPEQARAESVDAQSDLFAFGAVLYEMASGKPAFSGKTMATLFDQILNREPQPMALANPQAPAELAPIIAKALEKDRELRYRSAADIGADLKRVRRDLVGRRSSHSAVDAAEASSSSMERAMPAPVAPSTAPLAVPATIAAPNSATPRWVYIVAASLAVVVALSGFAIWQWRRNASVESVAFERLQVTQLTSTGNAYNPAVSPDGKYVVYLQGDVSGVSLWLRQVAATNSVKLVPGEGRVSPLAATIGPDSTFVDFTRNGGGGLFRIPFLGGVPKQLVDRVNTPVGWSPDGQRMAFIRPGTSGRGQDLVVTNREAGDEKVVATQTGFALGMPGGPVGGYAPAWSPDGRRIAMFERNGEDVRDISIRVFQVATGESTVVNTRGDVPLGLAWLDNATIVIAQALETGTASQLWRIAYPGGQRSRLSNDTNRYSDLSLSSDGNTLVTSRPETRVEIWVGDAKGTGREVVRSTPFLSSALQYAMVGWDGPRLLFTHTLNGRYEIFSIDADGGGDPKPIVAGREFSVASDGTIVYRAVGEEDGLWKVGRDGTRPVELAQGSVSYPYISADATEVVFNSRAGGPQTVWQVPASGGTPTQLLSEPVSINGFSDISPDGKSVVVSLNNTWVLCDLPQCVNRRTIGPIQGASPRWNPDGHAFTYIQGGIGGNNLWVQPIDGSPPQKLTQFDGTKFIGHFAWSRDGRLAISRVTRGSDIVLFQGLKGK